MEFPIRYDFLDFEPETRSCGNTGKDITGDHEMNVTKRKHSLDWIDQNGVQNER